ncbi:MAG: hypothetical protein KME19_17655 [Microcoleus vaginatus WJT46-NPBG5]|jgi:hypothetical protein|nr:hypothetical protein [Microcoleus vaginatus WJT46-NPBG5]
MLIAQHLWDLILFLIILGAPIPLCLSIALLNQRERNQSSFSHFLLVAITSWIIIKISLALLLGILQKLTLGSVIFLDGVIFIAGLIFVLYLRRYHFSISLKELLNFSRPLHKLELLIIGTLSFVGLIALERLATIPITDYDSLWFHLPLIARWYQTGSLTLLDPAGNWIFDHEQARVYPYNWQLLSTTFLMPFREDFLVAFPMLIAWVLLGLSVYLLSIKLGATRIYAMAASSLILTFPIILNHLNTSHVDMPFTSVFMVGLYLAFSYHQSRSIAEISLFLASIGLLLGMKIVGPIYAAILVIVFLSLEIRSFHIKNIKLDYFSRSILALGIFCLAFLGGFWYLKNFLYSQNYANKIEDFKIASANLTILPGLFKISEVQKSSLAFQFDPTNISHWQTLGIQLIVRLQIPFIAMSWQVLLLPYGFIKGKNKIKNKNFIYLITLLIGTGLLYLNTPYSSGTSGEEPGQLSALLGYNLRYGFPFFSLLGVAAAVSTTLRQSRQKVIVAIVIISGIAGILSSTLFDTIRNAFFSEVLVGSANQLLDNFKISPIQTATIALSALRAEILNVIIYIILLPLIIYLLLRLNLFKSSLLARFINFFKLLNRQSFVALCLCLIVGATWVAREKRDDARTEMYNGIYEYMETHIDTHEKFAYMLSRRSYLFYGRNLNRTVWHIPFDPKQSSQVLDELRQREISFLGVGPLQKEDKADKQAIAWLKSSEKSLIRGFGTQLNLGPAIYRLN